MALLPDLEDEREHFRENLYALINKKGWVPSFDKDVSFKKCVLY
jgi:hypothetical protein